MAGGLFLLAVAASLAGTGAVQSEAPGSFFARHPPSYVQDGESGVGRIAVADGVLTVDFDFQKGGRALGGVVSFDTPQPIGSFSLDYGYGAETRLTLIFEDGRGKPIFVHTFGILSGDWDHSQLDLTAGGKPRQVSAIRFLAENINPDGKAQAGGESGVLRVKNVVISPERPASAKTGFSRPLTDLTRPVAESRARAACARLEQLLPQLEAKHVGAKTRATYTVMTNFFQWIAADDRAGLDGLALDEMREQVTIGERAVARAEAILAGAVRDFPVPAYRTGRIEISRMQTIGEREWPDGRRDRGPVFFNGYGHFSYARQCLDVFPALGDNHLQTEIGPSYVVKNGGRIDLSCLTGAGGIVELLNRAAKTHVTVELLLSPHYWPSWVTRECPEVAACGCYYGFCPYHPKSREVLEAYLRAVTKTLRGHPALHSFCLSNEPRTSNYGKCPRLKAAWDRWYAKRHGGATAAMPQKPEDAVPPAVYAEFVRFNRECLAAWHKWMADVVHAEAPEIPVHAKIQVNPVNWRGMLFNCLDPVAFAELSDYNGNDAADFTVDARGPLWAHNWWWVSCSYDFQRAAAEKPIANTENHLHPDNSTAIYIPGEHAFAALWQQALHGQNTSALWCWSRSDRAKHTFAGLALNRPECLEGYAHCSLDLSRLADRLAPLQNQEASVLLVYSTEAMVAGKSSHLTAYRAASFLGHQLGVVSEEMLGQYARGNRTRPFASAKAILLPFPDSVALPASAQAGLDRFVSAGGTVVRVDGEKDERTLLSRLSVEAKAWKLPDVPRALDPKTGSPVFGVETRGVRLGRLSLISLCNHTYDPIRVRLEHAGTDLVSGEATPVEFDVAPLKPLLVEY